MYRLRERLQVSTAARGIEILSAPSKEIGDDMGGSQLRILTAEPARRDYCWHVPSISPGFHLEQSTGLIHVVQANDDLGISKDRLRGGC